VLERLWRNYQIPTNYKATRELTMKFILTYSFFFSFWSIRTIDLQKELVPLTMASTSGSLPGLFNCWSRLLLKKETNKNGKRLKNEKSKTQYQYDKTSYNQNFDDGAQKDDANYPFRRSIRKTTGKWVCDKSTKKQNKLGIVTILLWITVYLEYHFYFFLFLGVDEY